jgi:cystathionine beta-lyase
MKYNFSQELERRNTGSIKWDNLKEKFGREDILPMWVADSDWRTAPSIIEAIQKRVEHGVFGYTTPEKSLNKVIVNWINKRYNWDIKPEWIVHANGVVPSINIAINAMTSPGDEVILQSPVYHPFFSSIKNNGTHLINNQLKLENGSYYFNFQDLKDKLQDNPLEPSRAKLLILCNPHNPVGRAWNREELEELGDICLEKNITMISDEIHADFYYEENSHLPLASINEDLAQNSFSFFAPSKAFNIAGFHTSFAVIPNRDLRRKFMIYKDGYMGTGGIIGLTAMEAAYSKGEDWLDEQLSYLNGNIEYALNFIRKNISEIKPVIPEATYLLWLDCRQLNLGSEELNNFFIEKVGLALDPGHWFGSGGQGFMRMNLACPRTVVEKGLKQLERAIKSE